MECCPSLPLHAFRRPPCASKSSGRRGPQFYDGLEDEALSRLPRDAEDWQVVALALALGADILTEDKDFFGCGVATWTTETLITQLERRG